MGTSLTQRDDHERPLLTAPNPCPLSFVLRRKCKTNQVDTSAALLMHNHPGGDPTPSRADIEMTRVIVEIAKLLML
jgi:RadC-like JAB domain-containing protein